MTTFQRYRHSFSVGLSTVLLLGTLTIPNAYAAGGANDASQIQRRILEQVREDPVDQPSDPVVPSVTPFSQPDVESFTLTGVTVTGATVFTGDALAPFYEHYLAREVSRSDLMDIADAATALYQEHGYTLSRAYIPPQSIIAGVVELKIVEGYVEELIVAGETGGVDITPYTQNILAEHPLTQSTFERNLLLINDLAGLEVTDIALAEAVEGSGAYTLGLTVSYDAWAGLLYADNRGTRAVGPGQLGLTATLNSPFGGGEALTSSVYTVPYDPEELLFGQLHYQQPLGSDGLAVGLSGSYSRTNPGASLSAFGRNGVSIFGGINVQYPLIRMRNEALWIRGSFDVRNSSEETDLGTVSDDRLRVARLKIDYFRRDEWNGTNFVSIGVAQGLDILGASGAGHRWASRADGEVQFTKIFGNYYRRQQIWGNEWALAFRASGQKSTAPLLSAEEFGLGGARFGRAYEYGELTGDDGVAASVELQFSPDLRTPIADQFTFFGFYDIGAVWNRHAPSSSRLSLASAGGGVRMRIIGDLSATVEVGKPLTRDTSRSGDRGPQIHFSIYRPF